MASVMALRGRHGDDREAAVKRDKHEDAGRLRRAAVVAAATVVVGAGGYLVLVYPPQPVEFPMALMAGLIAGAATGALTVAAWPGWGRPSAGGRPLRLAGQLVGGFFRAAAVAVGRAPVRGQLATVPSEGAAGREKDPAAAVDRAIVGWTRSLAADSYVVAFDPEDSMQEHRLGRGPA